MLHGQGRRVLTACMAVLAAQLEGRCAAARALVLVLLLTPPPDCMLCCGCCRFGNVTDCDIIRDHKTGDSLCYAFIGYDNDQSCEAAYFKMNNVLIDDRCGL
jgi:hypothetical protein